MIRTTTVGSWPIPGQFKPQLTAYYRGELSDEEAHDVLQDAARVAMQEQRDCGLGQIMGGEVFAPDFVHHVPPRLAGLECHKKRDHRAGYEGIGAYEIVGDVSAPRGTGHALAFRREKTVAPDLDKAAVPSPLTIAGPFIQDPRRDEQMENLARIVEAEVLDMVAAGAAEVQLDAPVEMISLSLDAVAPQEVARWLSFPFRSGPSVRRSIHFCLGDMGKRPYTQEQHLHGLLPLLGLLDGQVDRVHIECSYAGQWEERGLLSEVPGSMEIVAGIADVKGDVQSADTLREHIAGLLEVVPPARLLVSSSCGCGRCSAEQARALMGNLVEAARAF